MKVLKFVGLGLLGLLILLSIGTYFFVKKRFTPAPNALELIKSSNYIPIKWIQSEYSDFAAILLPIKLEGIPHTFYMQFDTGVPTTTFYKGKLEAIREKYPDKIPAIDPEAKLVKQTLQLGEMRVKSDKFKLYDYGKTPINWEDSSIIRIGTLGSDMLEKKLTIIDFKSDCVFFGDSLPELEGDVQFHDLVFKGRRTLIPASIGGKKGNMMHDTGSSGFEFITSKKTWKKLARKGAKPKEAFKVKSWKRELSTYQIDTDAEMLFGSTSVKLKQVTYVEGASFMQSAMTRMTGLGGMIGNEIFLDKILIFDCKNKRYSVVK